MEPISNVDRLVLLLRQRLQERTRTQRSSKPGTGRAAAKETFSVQALAAVEGIDDRQLRRSLIQGILSEQFGQQMVNEPRFQQVVDRVADALAGDPDGDALLTQITTALRAAAKS